jgi:predicted transcriptional regulator
MTKKEKKEIAKKLYISGLSLDEIAKELKVTKRTIQNYKEKSWDRLRQQAFLTNGGDKLYKTFIETMNDFIKEIKDSDLKPEVKASKISQIGDAFSKMKKVASFEDPDIFRHGIIKKTVETLILNAKKEFSKECFFALLELIESLDEELSNVSI